MNNKIIKAVICDIDGTLMDRGQSSVSEFTQTIFNKIKQRNIPIIIATGRASYFIHPEIKEKIKPDFYATINGQLVLDNQFNPIQEYRLDANEIKQLIHHCKNNDIAVALKYEKEMPILNLYQTFTETYLKNKTNQSIYLTDHTQEDIEINDSNAPFGLFMIGPIEKIKETDSFLSHCVLSYAYTNAMEVFDKNIGKREGVKAILDKLGIKLEETIAFGDAHNDINLLEKVGVAVAMENASDDVKAIADYIAPPCHQDGVAQFLQNYLSL